MISDIERGAKSPSLNVVIALSEALGVTPSQLLASDEPANSGIIRLAKANQRVVISAAGARREHFQPGLEGSRLEFLRFVLPVGAGTGELPPHKHGGMEHAHVSSGTVEACVGAERLIARAGDTIVFPAGQRHSYRNVGKREAAIYVVIEPT